MKPKILLVTTVPYSSAARLAGAFAVLGADVEAVFPREAPIAVSRYLSHAHRYRPLAPQESLGEALRTADPDWVIPCDDRAAGLLAAQEGFDDLLLRALGPAGSCRVLMARSPSMAAARAEGIKAPLTRSVASVEELPTALAEIGLPCVMKSDFSWGGAGVKIVCSTEDAIRAFTVLQGPPSRLRSLVRAVKRKDLHFLEAAAHPTKAVVNLQSFVAGKPATSVFAARDGKVLAVQHMDVVSWAGDTGPASLMIRVDDPVMDQAAAKLAARFRLSGLHGLDFVRDASGFPHLIEVNPRATQICHMPLDGDLPAALLGVERRPPVTDLKRIALFPQLLTAGALPEPVFRDIPWDDPQVLRLQSGDALPEAMDLEAIAEFVRPAERARRRPG